MGAKARRQQVLLIDSACTFLTTLGFDVALRVVLGEGVGVGVAALAGGGFRDSATYLRIEAKSGCTVLITSLVNGRLTMPPRWTRSTSATAAAAPPPPGTPPPPRARRAGGAWSVLCLGPPGGGGGYLANSFTGLDWSS